MNINVAFHGGMAGNAALQVGTYQRIEVEMLELDRDLAREVVAQMQASIDVQRGILEIGLGPQQHLCAMGFCHCIQIACFFTVEHQMVEIQLCINHR